MSDSCWIETCSGKKFYVINPTVEMVCIEDIAHALSNQCRWTGHVKRFYSVAEHSLWVSRLCKPEDAMWGLLHDASEAYLCDLSRPVKHGSDIGPIYRQIEAKLMAVICEKFGLSVDMPKSVHEADNAMLFAEKRQLMTAIAWDQESKDTCHVLEVPEAKAEIVGYGPYGAKHFFLQRFQRLEKEQSYRRLREGI